MGEKRSELFKAGKYISPVYWPTWCVIGLLRLLSLLPYRWAMSVGSNMGRILGLLNPSRGQIVDINLSYCFPDTPERFCRPSLPAGMLCFPIRRNWQKIP